MSSCNAVSSADTCPAAVLGGGGAGGGAGGLLCGGWAPIPEVLASRSSMPMCRSVGELCGGRIAGGAGGAGGGAGECAGAPAGGGGVRSMGGGRGGTSFACMGGIRTSLRFWSCQTGPPIAGALLAPMGAPAGGGGPSAAAASVPASTPGARALTLMPGPLPLGMAGIVATGGGG